MAEVEAPGLRGLLLVSVWCHDGQLVGRVRAIDPLTEAAYDVAAEVGTTSLTEAVQRWLRSLEPSPEEAAPAGETADAG